MNGSHEEQTARFAELWNDFLEGELGEDRVDELQHLIAADDRLLKLAADSFESHRLLGLNAAESPDRREKFIADTMAQLPKPAQNLVQQVMRSLPVAFDQNPRRSRQPASNLLWKVTTTVALLMVGVGILAISLPWLQPRTNASIAKITGLSGSVLWTGDGGQVVGDLASGNRLSGGTLEGVSPNSWVELEFNDGTTVTVSGKSLLTFSEQQQKELYLREGNITAEVEPQPVGKPMLIHTRSADLEVLGTQFSLAADLASTMLNVAEGRVRVKRLHDGQQVDVPAQHRLVASADLQLVPKPTPNFVDQWKSRLELGPLDCIGTWSPRTGKDAARLRAIPFIFKPPGKGSEERSITLYLAALPVSRGDSQPVIIQPQSQFRIQGMLAEADELLFGFQVNHLDGSFAGKFLASGTPELEEFDGGNRFELVLAADDFQLDPSLSTLKERLPSTPSGLIISSCWCLTLAPRGLEVEQIELFSPD